MRIGSRIPLAGLLVFVLVAGVFADAARAETIKTSADGDYYGAAVYGVFSDADGFDTTGYADSYTVVRLMEFTGQFPAPMSATLFPPQFTVSPDSQFFMLGFVDVGAGDGNHLLISIDGADPNVPPPWTAPVALHDNLRDGILDYGLGYRDSPPDIGTPVSASDFWGAFAGGTDTASGFFGLNFAPEGGSPVLSTSTLTEEGSVDLFGHFQNGNGEDDDYYDDDDEGNHHHHRHGHHHHGDDDCCNDCEELLGSFTGGIGYSLTTDENGNLQFEVTDFDPVPEPGTITLLALGLGAGLGVRRRRSRRRAA